MNTIRNLAATVYVKGKQVLDNEKGAQSLEWLGLAALLIMVLGLVSTALKGGQGAIGEVITKIFTNIKNQIN